MALPSLLVLPSARLIADDFTALTNAEVFFAANSQSGATRVFSIAINNDVLVENDETLSLTLNTVTGGLVTISTATSVITIVDNDAASISVADISVNESAGNATVTVTLSRFCDGWLYRHCQHGIWLD